MFYHAQNFMAIINVHKAVKQTKCRTLDVRIMLFSRKYVCILIRGTLFRLIICFLSLNLHHFARWAHLDDIVYDETLYFTLHTLRPTQSYHIILFSIPPKPKKPPCFYNHDI